MSLVMYLPPAETEDGAAVSAALRKIMAHAVAGHDTSYSHAFCSDPQHALDILMDEGVVEFVLDEDGGVVVDS